MCGNACGRLKRTGQLGQRDITVLGQQFFEEGLMRGRAFHVPWGGLGARVQSRRSRAAYVST